MNLLQIKNTYFLMSSQYKYIVGGCAISMKGDQITKDELESGFKIDTKFHHQKYLIQYAEVIAISKTEKIIEVGDVLVFHFNVTAFTYRAGVRTASNLLIGVENNNYIYKVPNEMAHAVYKKEGGLIMLNNYCFIEPHRQAKQELESGFILRKEQDFDGAKKGSKALLLSIKQNKDQLTLITKYNYLMDS